MSHADKFRIAAQFFTVAALAVYVQICQRVSKSKLFSTLCMFVRAWLIAARKKKTFIQNSEWQTAPAVLVHLFVHRSSFANGL